MEQSSLTSSLHEAMIDNSEREESPVNSILVQESDNKNSYGKLIVYFFYSKRSL